MLARPERKKLVIVLTDGEPNDVGATKRAIQDARRRHVSVFGIYFEEGSLGRSAKRFEDMFEGRDIVACELADVDAQLSQLMERFARSK